MDKFIPVSQHGISWRLNIIFAPNLQKIHFVKMKLYKILPSLCSVASPVNLNNGDITKEGSR